jgi:hypothetical protein
VNKVPPVERDSLTGGLTTACASLWYAFLSDEYDWQGNRSLSEYYKRRSQELSVAPRGSLHDRQLEEAIKTWKR